MQELFSYPFVVNAMLAGVAVALLTGVTGWFVVLRGESFAAHTLGVVGFPGAAGATLLGLPPAAGYFAMTGLSAAGISWSAANGNRRLEESAVIGTLQACALALGYLFVTIGHRNLSSAQSLLFGSFLGVASEQAIVALAMAGVVLAFFAVLGRPLLFASIDPAVARSRGVPTRVLSTAFILAVGIAVAEASQITGSLLVFALIVMPPSAARTITARPVFGIVLSVVFCLFVTEVSLIVSFYSNYPVGFLVTTGAFALLLLTRLPLRRWSHRRSD